MEVPDWLAETPEYTYELTAYDPSGLSEQTVPVTVEEYKELKWHLAKLRGIVTPEAKEVHVR